MNGHSGKWSWKKSYSNMICFCSQVSKGKKKKGLFLSKMLPIEQATRVYFYELNYKLLVRNVTKKQIFFPVKLVSHPDSNWLRWFMRQRRE